MKSILYFMALTTLWTGTSMQAATLSNTWVEIRIDETTGQGQFIDRQRNEIVIDQMAPRFDERCVTDAGRTVSSATEVVETELGKGERLWLISEKAGDTALRVGFTLYEASPFIDISWSVSNLGDAPLHIQWIDVLNDAVAFGARSEFPNLRVLDGNGGGNPTAVKEVADVETHNNALLTFGEKGIFRRSLVIGGLTYHDFQKWARIHSADGDSRIRLNLFAPDAVGKRIDPGQTYASQDRFYIDFITDDPFDALEQYGFALRAAQQIKLNMYPFLTIDMWYVNFERYGGGQTGTNDTPGAVAEMEDVVRSGFLNYSPVAIRLIPDCYGYNNQQGWWDDEHWALHGSTFHTPIEGAHYKPPYETTRKWAQAVRALGGIPLTYFQTNLRSEDYAQQFPEHMLYNKTYAWKKPYDEYLKEFSPHVLTRVKDYPKHSRALDAMDTPPEDHKQSYHAARKRNNTLWGYDFTDPDFQGHMRTVYKNMRDGGLVGLMFDYAYSAWTLGGMEDLYSTSGAAYRIPYKLAYEGLGPECWVHERNLIKGSDMALGYIASQRTMGDTDQLTAKSVSIGGLRWYKNRVVVNFDADSKNINFEDRDPVRRVLTMSYVTQGRLLLANGIASLPPETLHDLSRTFPYHTTAQSARPVDAFITEYPSVYDFAVNDRWHQLTLWNDSDDDAKKIVVALSGDPCFGALTLSPAMNYHVYDFWNDQYVGTFSGADSLEQALRPAEVRMLSIHAVEAHPQFIATDRHVMQGYVDLHDVAWDEKNATLSGTSSVIEDEPVRVIIALNGRRALSCSSDRGACEIEAVPDQADLIKLRIFSEKTADVTWHIVFDQP